VEAAGVGLPRSTNSRMISRTRWAQSARNDRRPRCRYKTGTADPPPSAGFTCMSGCYGHRPARDSATASAHETSLSSSPPRSTVVGNSRWTFRRTGSGQDPISSTAGADRCGVGLARGVSHKAGRRAMQSPAGTRQRLPCVLRPALRGLTRQ
jgi:hypothetical protein